jgi:hypothetical protein
MKHLIIILLVLLLNVSCKKGLFETCVEGKVLNKNTGGFVANQKVYLLRQTAGNGFGGLGFEEVSSTTSSLSGYYKFVFKAKGETYFIQGTDDSNNDPRFFAGQPTGSIKNGKTSTVDVELTSKAIIQVAIKNISPYNSNDEFGFSISAGSLGAGGTTLIGESINQVVKNIIEGNSEAKINYRKKTPPSL